MSNEESAELAEPSAGAFDNPAALVASELPAVLVAPELAVLPVWNDEFDAAPGQPFAQRIGVIGAVGNHAFRLLPRTAFGTGDFDLGERGFRKRSFSRRGTFKPNSQRKTATVDQYHPLRSLAALGFTDRGAPFFAGAKLPSRNAFSHFSRPSPSSAPSSARQALSQTFARQISLSGNLLAAIEAVGGAGNLHAAPVCNTHRMPSRQARLDAHGRPRLSLRRFGSGSSAPTNSHCALLNNSNRFSLMQEVQQTNHRTQKFTA
jgi:hypothetical protein